MSVNAPASESTRHVAQAAALPQTYLFDVQQKWAEIIQSAMRDNHPQLATDLTVCRPISLAKGVLTLEAPHTLCDRSADDALILTTLARIIAQVAGYHVPVSLRPPGGVFDTRSARYQAAESHPLVQAIRKRFAADIIAREPITLAEWQQRQQFIEKQASPAPAEDDAE